MSELVDAPTATLDDDTIFAVRDALTTGLKKTTGAAIAAAYGGGGGGLGGGGGSVADAIISLVENPTNTQGSANSARNLLWGTTVLDPANGFASAATDGKFVVPASMDGHVLEVVANIGAFSFIGSQQIIITSSVVGKNWTNYSTSKDRNSVIGTIVRSIPKVCETGEEIIVSYAPEDATHTISNVSFFAIIDHGLPNQNKANVYSARCNSVSSTAAGNVSWNAPVFDDAGFYDAGSPTRFTIPAGFNRCEIHAQLGASGETVLTLFKNGSTIALGEVANTGGNDYAQVSSGVIDCAENDYFEVNINLTITAFADARSFSIKAWNV